MKKQKILISLMAIAIVLVALNFLAPKAKNYLHRQKIEKMNQETIGKISEEDIVIGKNRPVKLPQEAYLEVQFICQAPLETEANWVYHEESCEEAALLQALNYEKGETVTKQEANEIILDMIDWQNQNMGGHNDLYAEELKEFAMGYYGLEEAEIKIVYNAEIEDIKWGIAQGHPIIVPITGDILNNPYYPYPGYHMLVAIGYTGDRIITNDNGTRRGANFSYDMKVFEKAFKDAGGDIVVLELNQY